MSYKNYNINYLIDYDNEYPLRFAKNKNDLDENLNNYCQPVRLYYDPQKDIFKNIKHKLKVIPANILDDIPLREPSQLNTSEMFDELADVIEQYENKKVSDSLQKVADKNPMRMFKIYCKKMGLSPNWSYIEQVDKDLVHIIIELKKYYNRPRPTDMSLSLGMRWKGDDLSSAQTPSYPSGHTTQAYVIGLLLANQFPKEKPIY